VRKVSKEDLEKDFEAYIELCQKETIIIVDGTKEVAVLLSHEHYQSLKKAELALAYHDHSQDNREHADFELWETTVADGLVDNQVLGLKGSVHKYDKPLEPVALEDWDLET